MEIIKVISKVKESNIPKPKSIKKEKKEQMQHILKKLINMIKDLKILKKSLKIMMMIK
jgi:Mg2+ and Co2+ transporter CorA